MQVKKAIRYGVVGLLMTGLAPSSGHADDPASVPFVKLRSSMIAACQGVSNSDVKIVAFLHDSPETRARFMERTEFCNRRKDEIKAKQTEAKAKQAEASADAQAVLSGYKQRRDPSDVVEQVLNYALTGNESGADGEDHGGYVYPHWSFFIKESKCVYKMIDYVRRDGGPTEKRNDFTVDFSKYDSRLFDFKAIRERDSNGDWITKYTVLYDGKEFVSTIEGVSLERLRHGWTLIYSKYCTGTAKAF